MYPSPRPARVTKYNAAQTIAAALTSTTARARLRRRRPSPASGDLKTRGYMIIDKERAVRRLPQRGVDHRAQCQSGSTP